MPKLYEDTTQCTVSPCRNKFLAPTLKKCAKANIKVFRDCLTLPGFLLFSQNILQSIIERYSNNERPITKTTKNQSIKEIFDF